MIPVSTDVYWTPCCQCKRAAWASILELPIEATPQSDRFEDWEGWAAKSGASIEPFELGEEYVVKGYAVGFVDLPEPAETPGESLFDCPRRRLHAVVLCDGKIVHDPHRDKCGARLPVVRVEIIRPIDPHKPMTFRTATEAAGRAALRGDAKPELRKYAPQSSRRRRFIRAARRGLASARWCERLMHSWLKIDEEERAA